MKTNIKTTKRLTPAQARIAASVERAKRKVEQSASGLNRMLGAVKAAGDEWAKLDESIFGAFKILGPGWLDTKNEQREILQQRTAKAVADKDGNFLIRLGRALQCEPSQPSFDKLDDWLISAWLPQGEGMFGLCDCTDEAITSFLEIATSRDNLTVDAVVKRRQRLGLVKSAKPYVTGVRTVKGKPVWLGNGQQSHTRNVASIKSAVRDFWAKKRPSLTGSDLTQFLAARHPVLFDDALKGVSGVNEKRGGMKASNVADYLRLAANESAPGVMLSTGPVLKSAFN